ncbi:MAG: RimK family alpha-L-glutamate ligase [Anaerolineae bacterium]
MKIGILSRNPALYSTRRLVEAARTQGHEALVIDTLTVAVEVGEAATAVHRGVKVIKPRGAHSVFTAGRIPVHNTAYLPQVDAVIPRIGASITYYGLAVVRQFEARGALTTASSEAIGKSRDKLHSLQTMAAAGLPIPRTAVIARPEMLYNAVHSVGGTPVIIKLIQGTQGRGVLLAPNFSTVAAVLERLKRVRKQILVQEYVAESKGQDTRVIVVGDECVAAMTRIAAEGEFRANLHMGGTAVPAELDDQTRQLALAAARAHGLAVAGVDLIQSNQGPMLLEVNSSPGLEGFEGVTGADVAGAIVHFLEQQQPHKKRKRR